MESIHTTLFDINDEGDVVIPETTELEQPVPTAESDFDPDEELDSIRQTADFRNRNVRLMMAADHVGNQRQAEGAAQQANYGYKVSRRYLDRGHMEDIISERDDAAKEAIRRACASCALAEFCQLSTSDLQQNLREAKKRKRFKDRVTAENYTKNNHLCETNLKPGRLSKDRA